jgi:hypothetical protein
MNGRVTNMNEQKKQFLAQKISKLIYILPCYGKETVSRDNLGFYDIDLGLITSFSWFKFFICFLVFQKNDLFLRLLNAKIGLLNEACIGLIFVCFSIAGESKSTFVICQFVIVVEKLLNIVKPTNN